jgi:hypothetical protein
MVEATELKLWCQGKFSTEFNKKITIFQKLIGEQTDTHIYTDRKVIS